MQPRKLSLEERITLFNLIKHPVFSGARDNPIIRTVADYHSSVGDLSMRSERTVGALMLQLDKDGIPDTTNCPFPLYFIAEWVASSKQRLDLVRITHDRKLRFTSNEMREKILDMALDGRLVRVWSKLLPEMEELIHTVIYKGGEIHLKDGDMLVVQPDNREIYACWIDPSNRKKPMGVI